MFWQLMRSFVFAVGLVFVLGNVDVSAQTKAQEDAQKLDENLPSKEEILTVKDDDIVIGEASAPVTIFEYASMSCSHCAAFHNNVFPELKEKYIDTGKVKLVFRGFPLDESALRGSLLLRCGKEPQPEKFLKVLFRTLNNWAGKKNYLEIHSNIAKLGGITGAEFDACMADKVMEEKILTHRLHAGKVLDVRSTPTFFVNGEKHAGARNVEYFSKLIDGLLGEANKVSE